MSCRIRNIYWVTWFFDTLALKIEVRLRGQSADSFTFKQDASQHLYSLDENNYPKADFLTFATLRPIAILDSFIRILSDKHIGILTGEWYSLLSPISEVFKLNKL